MITTVPCYRIFMFSFFRITIVGTGAKWLSVLEERKIEPCEYWYIMNTNCCLASLIIDTFN